MPGAAIAAAVLVMATLQSYTDGQIIVMAAAVAAAVPVADQAN